MSKETFYIPPNLAFPDWNMFVYGMFTCIFILRAYASHTLKKTHTTPPPLCLVIEQSSLCNAL